MTLAGRTRLIGTVFTALVLLTGCAGWRPVAEVEIDPPPEEYNSSLPDATTLADSVSWWTTFNDPALDARMDSAFHNNLTFTQMLARHEQTRRQLYIARASWSPNVSASASYQRQDFIEEQDTGFNIGNPTGFDPSQIFVIDEAFNVGLTAAYELDLWGKYHAQRQGAEASFRASENDVRAYVISLSALVARSWYSTVMLQRTQDLLDSTVVSYQENVRLMELRFDRGVATSADLYQARTTLAGTRAEAEANASRLAATQHALSTLLAEYPHQGWVSDADGLPSDIPAIHTSLPGELVTRRPDVRAAFQRMVAADRSAAEAVASMFPSFSITGQLSGRSTDEIADAFDPQNMYWSAIGSMTAPIFQGGRLYNASQAAKAGWQAAVASYRQAVLTGFQEMEDALVSNQRMESALAARQQQAADAQASLNLAWDRYLRGVTNYLPVTIAQAANLNARRGLLQARFNLLDARIALATAAGGAWADDVLASVELDSDTATLTEVTDQ